MNGFEDIDRALLQAVADAGLGLPIAAENTRFDKPTNGAPWAAAFVVPTPDGVRAATCGAAGEDEHLGFLQVDVNYPMLSGTAAARQKLDQLLTAFPAGRPLSHGLAKVTIRSCSRSRGREVDGMYRVSATIYWYARVPRNTP